ncbi:hypothetical protein JXA88_13525 [Candidatus Fermentibacteria bacterium]|nr:hypothetical protein [Candidatus Fermentibacteria bacterium]
MSQNLVLSIPQGFVVATSLGIEGLARHKSPGSGKYFRGRSVFFDLAIEGAMPLFSYLDEGGWRDPKRDTHDALAALEAGSRTKTALSNNGFSCTPLDAHRRCFLVKTGGQVLELNPGGEVAQYATHECHEHMTPDEVAHAIGARGSVARTPRLYMVLSPIEFIVLSSLTPAEYAWYATHRPGKIFRQIAFAELNSDPAHLAAESRFTDARALLESEPEKKTKTIVTENCLNNVALRAWVGYQAGCGGLYAGDRNRLRLWSFPAEIPEAWDKVEG